MKLNSQFTAKRSCSRFVISAHRKRINVAQAYAQYTYSTRGSYIWSTTEGTRKNPTPKISRNMFYVMFFFHCGSTLCYTLRIRGCATINQTNHTVIFFVSVAYVLGLRNVNVNTPDTTALTMSTDEDDPSRILTEGDFPSFVTTRRNKRGM